MNNAEFHVAVLAELRGIRDLLRAAEVRAMLSFADSEIHLDGAQTRDAFGPRDATTGDPVPARYQPAAPAGTTPRVKSRRK